MTKGIIVLEKLLWQGIHSILEYVNLLVTNLELDLSPKESCKYQRNGLHGDE